MQHVLQAKESFAQRTLVRDVYREIPPPALRERSVFTYLEGMEVHFTPEQEAQIVEVATKAGTHAEALVGGAVLRVLEEEISRPGALLELPVLHLGELKSLRRREFYDDLG